MYRYSKSCRLFDCHSKCMRYSTFQRSHSDNNVSVMCMRNFDLKQCHFSTSSSSGKSGKKSGIQIILQYLLLFPIAYGSLLAGASLTHTFLKPDLTIPNLEDELETEASEKDKDHSNAR